MQTIQKKKKKHYNITLNITISTACRTIFPFDFMPAHTSFTTAVKAQSKSTVCCRPNHNNNNNIVDKRKWWKKKIWKENLETKNSKSSSSTKMNIFRMKNTGQTLDSRFSMKMRLFSTSKNRLWYVLLYKGNIKISFCNQGCGLIKQTVYT